MIAMNIVNITSHDPTNPGVLSGSGRVLDEGVLLGRGDGHKLPGVRAGAGEARRLPGDLTKRSENINFGTSENAQFSLVFLNSM